MTYVAPYIDGSGLHIPAFLDFENLLIQNAQTIFGAAIYLGPDSQDFQDIAARAQALYDLALSVQLAFNNRSPLTAVGAGLDSIVALNGITRKGQTNSTATVTLTGTAFTVISNGIVSDINGNTWNLPASVTIGSGGTVSVTATAANPGPITALAGQIINIQTPTLGWTSVTNASAASPGQSVETDSALRARQAVSVSNPSQALTTGILGAVLNVSGVISAQMYENYTSAPVSAINGVPNPSNFPANSITMVINGGANNDLASAIALRKTPGCATIGDQNITVYDQFGVPLTVNFYRPTQVSIDVTLTVKTLNGYTATIGTAAQTAIVNYINSLVAGQSLIISELWQAALSVITTTQAPQFSVTSVTAGLHGGSQGATNLTMNFNQQPTTVIAQVTLIAT